MATDGKCDGRRSPTPEATMLPAAAMQSSGLASAGGTGGTSEEDYAPLSPRLSMARRMREQMTGILQPITSHILELQQRLEELKPDVRSAKAFADAAPATLKKHELQIFGLEAEVNHGLARKDWCISELDHLRQRMTGLEEGRGALLRRIDETDQNCLALERRAEDLRKSAERLDACTSELSKEVEQLRVAHPLHAKIEELSGLIEGVNQRELELVQKIEKNRTYSEKTSSSLETLAFNVKMQDKEVWKSLATLKDSFHGLDTRLGQVEFLGRKQGKQIADSEEIIERLDSELDGLQREVREAEQAHENWKNEVRAERRSFEAEVQKRAGLATAMAETLQFAHALDKKLQEQIPVIRDLVDKDAAKVESISRHATYIESLEAAQKDHDERIATLQKAAEEQIRLQAQIDAGQTAQFEGHFQVLNNTQDKAAGQLNKFAAELEAMQQLQCKMQESLTTTRSSLSRTDQKLEVTQADLMGVAMRLDLAHEYFHGLGKGLRDTHKHVIDDKEGLLSPKAAAQRKVLPALHGSFNKSAT